MVSGTVASLSVECSWSNSTCKLTLALPFYLTASGAAALFGTTACSS